jgi:hypothetical protein
VLTQKTTAKTKRAAVLGVCGLREKKHHELAGIYIKGLFLRTLFAGREDHVSKSLVFSDSLPEK